MGSNYFTHIKTGDVYKLLFRAKMEHDSLPVAVYESGKTGQIWVRPLSEFNKKFQRTGKWQQ